jgi:hypothetical protein
VVGLLFVHAGLLGCHSPVDAEVVHLAAGVSHVGQARFDLFRVNPPLVRMVATLPVACASPATDWTRYSVRPLLRSEFPVGSDFVEANGFRSFWLFTLARWACIPFSLIGGYSCYRWAERLNGPPAGLMALGLWCFCPFILGQASLITPDAHAAAMGVAACYAFWRWLRAPDWSQTIVVGIALGLAELTKFTLLVLYPLLPALWIIYRLPQYRKIGFQRWSRETRMLLTTMVLSLLVINVGYGFEGSFSRLAEYSFESRSLRGEESAAQAFHDYGNCFSGTSLGSLPIPVPRNYLLGIDRQKWEFERELRSYLHGHWQMGGWWYYYLYALGVKVPLGIWVLGFLSALAIAFGTVYSDSWRDEVVLLASPVAILVLVSSQTSFSSHSRYALPILPFGFIWVSRLARSVALKHRMVGCATGLALSWAVLSSLWAYPHSLSYFNELAGGPAGGHVHLLGSNIAWGQDLLYLAGWSEANPQARPLHVACVTTIDPRLVGIQFTLPPVGPTSPSQSTSRPGSDLGPQPGWFAIDVNCLEGSHSTLPDGQGGRWISTTDGCGFDYFRRCQPVAMVGYSILIFRIAEDEANRVRRELGLPQLAEK